ncbi:hypothetical protein, partial [Klebsiella pneumoniae]|uniref:hypothetical protein n=1 Tax=Klebsiella pneumoniae TaxID=573 RepID=UPI0021581BF1
KAGVAFGAGRARGPEQGGKQDEEVAHDGVDKEIERRGVQNRRASLRRRTAGASWPDDRSQARAFLTLFGRIS